MKTLRNTLLALTLTACASSQLGAMNEANQSLSLPQTYHQFSELFIQLLGTGNACPEFLPYILRLQYLSDPIAFVQKLEDYEIESLFNQISDEFDAGQMGKTHGPVFKMALRLGYAKKYQRNIDTLDCVDFLSNFKDYGVNSGACKKKTPLLKQQYLACVLPLLEVSINERVTKLYLGDSKLTVLPESIGCLEHLTVLSLYKNQLTELPESIGNLGKLQRLYIHNNKLTKLPSSIGNLGTLNVLHIQNNLLTEVPNWFSNINNKKLKDLSLFQIPLGAETKVWLRATFGNKVKI